MELKCVVVIPVYKEILDCDDHLSINSVKRNLSNYDIVFVAPYSLHTENYTKIVPNSLVIRFSDEYFVSNKSYNNLMFNVDFWKCFSKYEFMLIVQTDAYIFNSDLEQWFKYDYVGAPWFKNFETSGNNPTLWKTGNGGLSLRRISKMIEVINDNPFVLQSFQNRGINEDYFFSNISNKVIVPSPEKAAEFAFEAFPSFLYNKTGKLPFGCHAWKKYEYNEFWKKYIN